MRKGQLKIQEMAFALIGIIVLFGIAFLLFAAVRFSGLREDARTLRAESAQELVIQLAGTPELSWKNCPNCIDLDKAFAIKDSQNYKEFWSLEHLSIEIIHPKQADVECVKGTYPYCNTITLINKSADFGILESSFVSLCRYEFEEQGFQKCVLGKIYASGRALQ